MRDVILTKKHRKSSIKETWIHWLKHLRWRKQDIYKNLRSTYRTRYPNDVHETIFLKILFYKIDKTVKTIYYKPK